MNFKLIAPYKTIIPQQNTINSILDSLKKQNKYQTVLWVTWSGKTFIMANIIESLQKPTLIIAHNKTLAAQLASEFKEFFPNNAVHYFVSYYDYYQPEAFVKKTNTYIEKEATINEEIDRLRHAATESLLSRKDVIIVASVSCIYWIWEVKDYLENTIKFEVNKIYKTEDIIKKLVDLQFKRTNYDFKPWMFRVQWDIIEIFPSSEEFVWVLDFFNNKLEKILKKSYLLNNILEERDIITIFPAKHTITTDQVIKNIVPKIKNELEKRIKFFKKNNMLIEAERLKTKVEYDIEMMQETWYVNWIENYSMYLSWRKEWQSPSTLIDFFQKDFLTFIDESHITISQIGWMHAWDRSRKESLINAWFRLPSAFENRPLRFNEFLEKINQTIFVSATPKEFELKNSKVVAEQIIRPTWLLDPQIIVNDMKFAVDDITNNIAIVKKRWEKILVVTLTKKSSEQLTEYFISNWIKASYLHSEIDTLERLEILKNLRTWKIDVLVWVNLLREWLDLPEVSLICIIDAEKQWFLRSTNSLLQIIWRASRNINWKIIMYSYNKKISQSMKEVIDITNKRRFLQEEYNKKNNIIPTTIFSKIKDFWIWNKINLNEKKHINYKLEIKKLELEMDVASVNLDFEKAAQIRDLIIELKQKLKNKF
jgi:excinuclease ABC subunit B